MNSNHSIIIRDLNFIMLKKQISLFISLFIFQLVFSQSNFSLSNLSQISIITSGPGNELYEKFGHTAIRVKDPVLQIDLIYNYGIINFDNPNFYLDFTKGYMKYRLARYPFYLALKSSQQDKRWVKEQILNLTKEQKNQLFNILETNALPENASYFYDPFFDNCATKPRDIIQKVLGNNLVFNESFATKDSSIRELMNLEIHPNTWGSLGINIALGSKLDKIATPSEYLYLPDYLFLALKNSKVVLNSKEENLVIKSNTLLDFEEKLSKSDTPSPFLVILVFSLFGIFITYRDFKKNKRTKWLDFLTFFITGTIGFLVIFLWFFTNHSTAPNNFNFLWAFAPNLIVAFLIIKESPKKWIKKYVVLLITLLLIIPIIWITRIQLFTYPILPLFIYLAIRYLYIYKKLSIANS